MTTIRSLAFYPLALGTELKIKNFSVFT